MNRDHDRPDRFDELREPKIRSWIESDTAAINRIEQALRHSGLKVQDLQIDPADFEAYLTRAGYPEFQAYYDGGTAPNFIEKALEHYLAARLLELAPQDRYIDIASASSPVPEIYSRLFGCETWRQDLAYPPGLHGDRIGGDACSMPVPDGFATKIALHCSFEHFENSGDIDFLAEAERVLAPGGRVCILPLYLSDRYAIQTDPCALADRIPDFEPEAILFCADGWSEKFGRFYDVPNFVDRICLNLGGFTMTLYQIRNLPDLPDGCYAHWVVLLEKRPVK